MFKTPTSSSHSSISSPSKPDLSQRPDDNVLLVDLPETEANPSHKDEHKRKIASTIEKSSTFLTDYEQGNGILLKIRRIVRNKNRKAELEAYQDKLAAIRDRSDKGQYSALAPLIAETRQLASNSFSESSKSSQLHGTMDKNLADLLTSVVLSTDPEEIQQLQDKAERYDELSANLQVERKTISELLRQEIHQEYRERLENNDRELAASRSALAESRRLNMVLQKIIDDTSAEREMLLARPGVQATIPTFRSKPIDIMTPASSLVTETSLFSPDSSPAFPKSGQSTYSLTSSSSTTFSPFDMSDLEDMKTPTRRATLLPLSSQVLETSPSSLLEPTALSREVGVSLIAAASTGDIDTLLKIIASNDFELINGHKDGAGRTALNIARLHKKEAAIALLTTLQNLPELYTYIDEEDISGIKAFLKSDKHGISLFAQHHGDRTLHYTVLKRKFAAMQIFLRAKPHVKYNHLELQNYGGHTALSQYIDSIHLVNQEDRVKYLQEFLKHVDPNAVGQDGTTPLILACKNEWLEGVQTLLPKTKVNLRAECNVAGGEDQIKFSSTALDQAVLVGDTRIITVLLEARAAVNAQNPHTGQTALHLAVIYDQPEAATILLNYGARIDIPDHELNTPIHQAALFNKPIVLGKLCEKSDLRPLALAQLLIGNSAGHTPLVLARDARTRHKADHKSWEEIITNLTALEKDADINEQEANLTSAVTLLLKNQGSGIESTSFEGAQATFFRLKMLGKSFLLRILKVEECHGLVALDTRVTLELERYIALQSALGNKQFLVSFVLPTESYAQLRETSLIGPVIKAREDTIQELFPSSPISSTSSSQQSPTPLDKFKSSLFIQEEFVGCLSLNYETNKLVNRTVVKNNRSWNYASGRKSIEQVAVIFREYMLALRALHKGNYVYLDPTPDNILFTLDDSDNVTAVKLIDFGKAQKMDSAQNIVADLTSQGFNSPQLHECRRQKIKTRGIAEDYFAAAALLFEVITETRAPSNADILDKLEKIYPKVPTDPNLLRDYYDQYRKILHSLMTEAYQKAKKDLVTEYSQDERLLDAAWRLIEELITASNAVARERIDILNSEFLHGVRMQHEKDQLSEASSNLTAPSRDFQPSLKLESMESDNMGIDDEKGSGVQTPVKQLAKLLQPFSEIFREDPNIAQHRAEPQLASDQTSSEAVSWCWLDGTGSSIF